ncbi:MAG: hypothetical protein SFX73_09060 [Kofleriaceae bacterium]|nr:hypothetical protein [Kofleriaceae bacterium]
MRSTRVIVLAVAAACGDDGAVQPIDARPVADVPIQQEGCAGVLSAVPDTLAGTGLCSDGPCANVAAEATLYAPQFELYSDTATKRRWICLPPGTNIDTSNMEYWKFPVGTRVWKEFTRDGTRVETRFITKVMEDDLAPGSWLFAAYEWNSAQDAATLANPTAGVQNANGTQHDIPSRSQCRRCHEGLPSRVLGFGAMSLDYAAPDGTMDLDDAIAANMLSTAPSGTTPRFALPGQDLDHRALGYLHANCGHCHNPESATHDSTPLALRLETTKLTTLQATPTYATTYDVNGTRNGLTGKIVDPANTDNSVLLVRLRATQSPPRMPEIGIEMQDTAADTLLESWIDSL